MEERELIIIGSGPAGGTAALYASRAGIDTLVLHGETPGGQLTGTTILENFPGWKGTGPEFVQTIEDQATEAGAEFRYEIVTKCSLSETEKIIHTDSGTIYSCKALIIATGAKEMLLGLPNEARLHNKGVCGCALCDGPLYRDKNVVVVGGGDVATENALYLNNICKNVKLIHRRNELRASLPMKKKIANSTVEMIWDSVIFDVLGEEKVTGLRIKNLNTNEESTILCDALFVSIGHSPATKPFKEFIKCDERGYIITNGLPETNIPGIFAAGDCMDSIYRQAVTSAMTGCRAALKAQFYL